jgi:phytoene desaturase (3,4-didehydrolycopene-forming)
LQYAEAFAALGSPLEEILELQRVGPSAAYRVFFSGEAPSSLDLLYDADEMAAQVEAVEAGGGAAYLQFLAMARRHLDMGVPFFIERDYVELCDAAALAGLLPRLPSVNPWQLLGPHDAVMRGFFRDPRLRAMLTFQDLYVGLTPRSAPGVFSLLAGTELLDGVMYPVGGFGAVRDALRAAAERCGVRVRTRAAVQTIQVGADGAVRGVLLQGGEALPADVVVCNRDLPAAYSLLNASSAAAAGAGADVEAYGRRRGEELGGMQFSAGVIAYNWCVTRVLPALLHHNTFLSDDFEGSWRLAATPAVLPRRPNFYVHCPARTDPTAAPEGCDSVMVLLPVASLQPAGAAGGGGPPGGDYAALIAAGRERVLAALREAGVGDLAPLIKHELVIAPPEWEARYGLRHGAAFGLAHGLNQLSVLRPPNKDAEVGGLYFVGASTRPGNGVPLCFIGARITAQRVLKDLGMAAAAAAQ